MVSRGQDRWSRASLRTQIAVLMTTVTIATLIVTFGVMSWSELRSYEQQVVERLATEAEIVATGSEAAVAFDDPEAATETLAALKAAPHVQSAKLLRPDGTELATYLRAGRTETAAADTLQRSVDVLSQGKAIGSLEIVAGRDQLYAALYSRAMTSLIVLGLAVMLTLVLAFRLGAVVAGPVTKLTTTARKIADAGDYTVRAGVSGSGEVRDFVEVFNEMIERIDKRDQALTSANEEIARSSRALVDASRRAGMAEMAVGVLHNVGNALTSVLVSASLVGETGERFEMDRVRGALKMLSEEASDAETQALALQYLDKMGARHEGLVTTIRTEVDALLSRLEHVQAIIAQQQDTARGGSNVIETVALDGLVDAALELVGDTIQRHGIEVVREFAPTDPFPVDRHKVLQILVNLLTNAKHAIVQESKERTITVVIRRLDESKAEIMVRDTGMGISASNIGRVFEAGFTTRKDGHGFGLHASANAAAEMGGELDAKSAGEHEGATFRLSLVNTPQPVSTSEHSETAPKTAPKTASHAD